ncbi:hypothetical protein HY634_00065 [Candidatus Uhrbacteria bacterium]|nr:hypothetical protein [Candidatus Uhrbacteria bacterium]
MPTSPIEGFCDRLDRHARSVERVVLTHHEGGDGIRTSVQLHSISGSPIDEWEDEGIRNDEALRALRERWASVEQHVDGSTRTYALRIPRRRPEARP